MRNCCICGHDKIKEIYRIKKFPVFMGAVEDNVKPVFQDLVYGTCEECENLQLMELVPLELLYQVNHNTEVVGQTWEEHNTEFAKFIAKSKPKVVFEIGSPSATIFKKLAAEPWLEKWFSMEPNPSNIDGVDKKFIMKTGWVDASFHFEKHDIDPPNAVVMSHVFEHLYNPREILRVLLKNMDTGGDLYISIPDMEYISKNKLMPPAGMHFEHTFFLDRVNARYLLQTCGFEVMEIQEFKNHSLFIHAKSTYDNLGISLFELVDTNNSNNKRFLKTIKSFEELISDITCRLCSYYLNIYIYGAHFPAQFMYFQGLDISNLAGCLDQSPTKIGKKLYGTHLRVFHPEEIRGKDPIKVICHMGPYTDEIKKTLLKINNKIKFL